MNAPLERVLEGIVATLRDDVVPHVADPYARGQAIGVIDLLGQLAARIEWARGPLLEAVTTRRAALEAARAALPGAPPPADAPLAGPLEAAGAAELVAERARLDGEIARLLAFADGAGAEAAMEMLRQAARADLEREMAMTRKPSFGEISGSSDGAAGKGAPDGEGRKAPEGRTS